MTNTKAAGHKHTPPIREAEAFLNALNDNQYDYNPQYVSEEFETLCRKMGYNLNLIAAAPELLEALELCLDAIQPYYDSDDDGSKEAQASNTALAAIAKAKGGAK